MTRNPPCNTLATVQTSNIERPNPRVTHHDVYKTFYTNVSSCVLNNGFTTDLFSVRCGVRQGDPLSPLLFILALEVLACRILEDNEIKGTLATVQTSNIERPNLRVTHHDVYHEFDCNQTTNHLS